MRLCTGCGCRSPRSQLPTARRVKPSSDPASSIVMPLIRRAMRNDSPTEFIQTPFAMLVAVFLIVARRLPIAFLLIKNGCAAHPGCPTWTCRNFETYISLSFLSFIYKDPDFGVSAHFFTLDIRYLLESSLLLYNSAWVTSLDIHHLFRTYSHFSDFDHVGFYMTFQVKEALTWHFRLNFTRSFKEEFRTFFSYTISNPRNKPFCTKTDWELRHLLSESRQPETLFSLKDALKKANRPRGPLKCFEEMGVHERGHRPGSRAVPWSSFVL